MKFNMIVLMTSCDPKRAFKTPGIAPQNAAGKSRPAKQSGIREPWRDRFAKVIPTQAVANAAT